MTHVIRRAGHKDHARITEIRNAVTENVLGGRKASIAQPGGR